jgi:DEAD/DEAH box helicase domain-containing protein
MTGDTRPDQRLGIFVPHLPNILAVSPDLLHYQLSRFLESHNGNPGENFCDGCGG